MNNFAKQVSESIDILGGYVTENLVESHSFFGRHENHPRERLYSWIVMESMISVNEERGSIESCHSHSIVPGGLLVMS